MQTTFSNLSTEPLTIAVLIVTKEMVTLAGGGIYSVESQQEPSYIVDDTRLRDLRVDRSL